VASTLHESAARTAARLALRQRAMPADMPQVDGSYMGPLLRSPDDEAAYLPDALSMYDVLVRLSPEDRAAALRTRMSTVKSGRDLVSEAATAMKYPLTLLDTVVHEENTEASRSLKSSWPFREQWISQGRPNNALRPIGKLGYRLNLSQGSTSEGDGEELACSLAYTMLQNLDGDTSAPFDLTKVAASPRDSARLLLQIRCLFDVYNRYGIALKASAETGYGLATVLALWRAEGDMTVPSTLPMLSGEDVARVTTMDGVAMNMPLACGRSRAAYNANALMPYWWSGICLIQQTPHELVIAGQRLSVNLQDLPPSDLLAEDAKSESPFPQVPVSFWSEQDPANNPRLGSVCGYANDCYHALMMGLDVMFEPSMRTVSLLEWLARNWKVQPSNDASLSVETQVRQSYSDRYNLLAVRSIAPSGLPPAWIVGPAQNAISYAAGVVAEGVRYFGWLSSRESSFLPALAPNLPPILTYLGYHTGIPESGGQGASIVASAIGHATQGSSQAAVALAQTLVSKMSSDVNSLIEGVMAATSQAQVAAAEARANQLWPTLLRPIVEIPAVAAALASYIRSATAVEWPTRLVQRANVVRFAMLFDFYAQVFGQAA